MRFIAAASQCTQNCFEHHCMIVEASFALVFYGILSLASKLMWWSISPSHCRTRLCNALDAPFANRLLQSDYESSLGLHFKHNKCLAVFLFHPPFGLFFFSKRFTFKLFNLTVSPCVAYCTSFTPTPFSLSAKIRSFLRLNFIKKRLKFGPHHALIGRMLPIVTYVYPSNRVDGLPWPLSRGQRRHWDVCEFKRI